MQIQAYRGHHHPIHRAARIRMKRISLPIASVAILLSLTMIGNDPRPRRANDRVDSPTEGETVYYRAGGGWHDIAYSKQTCPQGDGQAKGGYDTISFAAVAKNIMTVGAVHGPVSEGIRDLSHAGMTDFSRWRPTDDGRIKPDIVAAGVGTTLSDDPTSRLIHDLDLRVIGPDESTVYYPYILNPVEPTAPATTGDNARDNVEQVCLPTPSERGLYEVRVSCKSDLRAERGGMKDRRLYPSRTCDAARAACRSGKKVKMRSRLVIRNTRCNWESRVQTATWPPCGLT